MAGKRKDHKGRVLKTGESQRKDLLYQYRYTNPSGKRITVYAPTLSLLREKEEDIKKALNANVDYNKGLVSMKSLIERYLHLKQNIRPQTMQTYWYFANIIFQHPISSQPINSIKTSQAKQWLIELKEEGIAYNTILHLRSLAKSAFQMAYEEDVLTKNPFDFKIDVLSNDSKKREALTIEQQNQIKVFLQTQPYYSHVYDVFVILLGTGLRVSELCGLTISDIDFQNKRIYINKQILRDKHGNRHVSVPKTKNGARTIPMLPEVEASFRSVLNTHKKEREVVQVDGYSGFVFFNKSGNVTTSDNIESSLRYTSKKYNEVYKPDPPIYLSAHVLRHTFCTNLALKNINIKSLQYLMGHSSVKLTLDLYSHVNYEQAETAMLDVYKLD